MKECLVAVEDSRGKRVLLFVLRNGGTQIELVLVKCKRAGCAMIEVPLSRVMKGVADRGARPFLR
jgi:hypothetical protein